MKIDKIEEYIKNPSLLGKKDIPDLSKLIDEYPYFQTAHMLLSGASRNAEIKELDEVITKSSVYISDRHLLYMLLNNDFKVKTQTNGNATVSNKNADNIVSVKTENNIKPETEIAEDEPKIEKINQEVTLPEIKIPEKTAEEKLTERGKSVHEKLVEDIIVPIVESEKKGFEEINDIKEIKHDLKIKSKEQISEIQQNKEPKIITNIDKDIIAENKSKEFTNSAELLEHIVKEKLSEKESDKKLLQTEQKIEDKKIVESKVSEGKVSKSITDDIFDKIANLKIDKTKTNIIDGKSNGVKKEDLYKNRTVQKITGTTPENSVSDKSSSTKIIIKKENIKPEEITEKKEEKITEPETGIKPEETKLETIVNTAEINKKSEIEITQKEVLKQNSRQINITENEKKQSEKLETEDDKPLELPDNEEEIFIKKVIAEIKGAKTSDIIEPVKKEEYIELNTEKNTEEIKQETKPKNEIEDKNKTTKINIITKKTEVKKPELQHEIKTEQPNDKEADAADSVFDKIAAFKRKRLANKDEKNELIEKFIQTEPKIDRTKEIEISGDVSKESTKERQPVVTELMANILINQGHFDKAIEIFNQLILKNPEKKDYFANKIIETEKMKK